MAVFWVVAPCSLVQIYRRFIIIALMMKAARTFETLVNFYQTTRRYNLEDSHLLLQIYPNLFTARSVSFSNLIQMKGRETDAVPRVQVSLSHCQYFFQRIHAVCFLDYTVVLTLCSNGCYCLFSSCAVPCLVYCYWSRHRALSSRPYLSLGGRYDNSAILRTASTLRRHEATA
jgi:hypothetical protein